MSRPVRRVLAAVASAAVVGGALLMSPPLASAAPASCVPSTLNKQVKQADVVFRGVVEKVRGVTGKDAQRVRTYKVKADRVYRSSLVADSVVVTARVGVACAPPTLKKGKRYIFFVTENGSRLMMTPSTARATQKLTARVVARLGNGQQPHQAPPTTAEFSKVADAAPPRLSRLLAPGAALLILSLLGLAFVGRLNRAR